MLQVLDIPEDKSKTLSSSQKRSLIAEPSLVPMKVTLTLIDMFPSEEVGSVNQSYKRVKVDVTSEEIVENTSIIIGDKETRNSKATKSDDAQVPEFLWNDILVPDGNKTKLKALYHFRRLGLRWWYRHLEREFLSWFRNEHKEVDLTTLLWNPRIKPSLSKEGNVNWAAGLDCLRRARGSNWWEWTLGSRPFFWRWPREYMTIIRDGLHIWQIDPLPQWRVPQRKMPTPLMQAAVRRKLAGVRHKGYIKKGTVTSLTSLFAVPKGDDDIRLVYDGTKSGLNRAVWAPWFPLPTVDAHLRAVEIGSFMGDIDIGEMFLNFMMHQKMQQHAGVDLTPFFPEELAETNHLLWEHWERCGMGFRFSPYQTVQGMLFAEEVIRGDPADTSNVLAWDIIVLNLPGDPIYDPSKCWVFKARVDGRLACDFLIYVDDCRTIGGDLEEARSVSRRVASVLNFLGLQDAPRKRRDPSKTPGAWAGSILDTSGDVVSICVSQERWDKAKGIIQWMLSCIAESDKIDFKTLESHRGFLIYLVRTYPAMNPYLKGIHLTLDSWRPWRKDDGWRMTLAEIKEATSGDENTAFGGGGGEKAPKSVQCVPRFYNDVKALERLFSTPSPPKRPMRLRTNAVAIYQFGDASGVGFGSSLSIGDNLYYRHGQWAQWVSEESSNYRELANLIHAIEDAHAKGLLNNSELFVFTDNSTAEGAFYKGTSSSVKLFELVLKLRTLQMSGGLAIHVIHISGKRMIAQGTDGLSRGSTTSGVMSGASFGSFVPLHQSVIERQISTDLTDWVTSWAGEVHWMTPCDWYRSRRDSCPLVWCPAPAAADACLDQLGKCIHMRPHQTTHVVIIPRLMTSRWRKTLGKICDLVLTVPLGVEFWPLTHFEPIIVGIAFPLSRHKPWRLRGTPLLESVEGVLRSLPPSSPGWGRGVLRKLFFQTRALETMSTSMVRSLLHPTGSK